MRQKDLKFPFRWEERHPEISQGVLFIPEYYQEHQSFKMPVWKELFGADLPIVIEYCSGNGSWLIDRAKSNPNIGWVAVEWRFERVRKIWSKARNLKLNNVFIVCGEALTFSQNYLDDACVDNIFINFPDPWPKEKHAKNRLIQGQFVDQIARIAKPNAEAVFVTDDPTYRDQILKEMLASPKWNARFPTPYYLTEWPDYGTSYFDTLWRDKGLQIHYMSFQKQ